MHGDDALGVGPDHVAERLAHLGAAHTFQVQLEERQRLGAVAVHGARQHRRVQLANLVRADSGGCGVAQHLHRGAVLVGHPTRGRNEQRVARGVVVLGGAKGNLGLAVHRAVGEATAAFPCQHIDRRVREQFAA
ncbi:hypothetical protein GCM10022247_70370 [Allokutzneria multivorans]|uniref:Uncharacterized protein n=1 Tax=Allokutzneria multivorans TaxID=1142134 RepID=A0ABP7U2U8_9PSEU